MAQTHRILIIGAGMGGLAAACALGRQGFAPEVREAASHLGEVGAGIQMTPNAVNAMRGLGLYEPLLAASYEPDSIFGRDWKSGRTIFRTPLKGVCKAIYGAEYLDVHRAELHRILREALPASSIRVGARCTAVRNEGDLAVASFADGSEEEADLVIGADGIRSAVRRSLFGDADARFTGNMCWRLIVPFERGPDFDLVPPDMSIWLGPDGHVVTYYMGGAKMVNIVAVRVTDTWLEESWTTPSTREELLAAFAGWHPKLRVLFERGDNLYKWGLFDRDPMPRWSEGRITLLGDAAHPMLPYLSQGAAMAIEDGCVLARLLRSMDADVPAVLRAYERERIPRTGEVQIMAREQGTSNHLASPLKRLWRDAVYRLREAVNPQKTGLGAKGSRIYAYDVTRRS